jgi:YfiR/HmsC-like
MRHHHLLPLLLAALSCASVAVAGEPVGREDQFKAAYVFNFLKFVEWPASVPSDVLAVCVVGADGVYAALASDVDTKRAGSRRLVVRRLDQGATAAGCNALYIEAKTSAGVEPPAPAGETPILTVSDSNGFAQRGGMIELFTSRNRLRFSINVDNAQKAGLRISSNLLQLAATVERSEH